VNKFYSPGQKNRQLFILYNAEFAQRRNRRQYLKNLLKITCIRQKVFYNMLQNTQNKASACSSIVLRKGSHNRMLNVTCHRNVETTYLKDLEGRGGGGISRRLLLKFRFIVLSEFRCKNEEGK
jgi:hypothetical protein